MSHPKIPTCCLRVLLVACVLGLVPTAPALARPLAGGPCTYADFPGTATITAIAPLAEERHGLPYAGRSVTFTFAPDTPINGEPLYVPGNIHHLTLAGGRAPGQRFVDHYKLRPGLSLPCRLRLIRKGTCTPVLFEFPGIDLTSDIDYPKK